MPFTGARADPHWSSKAAASPSARAETSERSPATWGCPSVATLSPMARRALVATLALALAACGGNGSRVSSAVLRSRDVVLFGVSASTNPDIGTPGLGIGVVEGLLTRHPALVARSDRWVAIPDGQWLAGMRLLANQTTTTGFTGADDVVELHGDTLERVGALREPFSLTWSSIVSPDGRLVAATQAFRAGAHGRVRAGPLTAVASIAGGGEHTFKLRGQLLGWADAHRLAFLSQGWLGTLDLRSDSRTRLVSLAELARDAGARQASIPNTVTGNQLIGSADGALVAFPLELTYSGPHPLRRGSVVAVMRIRDHTLRLVSSPLQISMFAFAPQGDRYAYTTSGFPEPHELWVGRGINQPTKRIYFTTDHHFDWITWSPDTKWLLVDDQLNGPTPVWRLIPSDGRGSSRTLPRLGGHPLWCCREQTFFGW